MRLRISLIAILRIPPGHKDRESCRDSLFVSDDDVTDLVYCNSCKIVFEHTENIDGRAYTFFSFVISDWACIMFETLDRMAYHLDYQGTSFYPRFISIGTAIQKGIYKEKAEAHQGQSVETVIFASSNEITNDENIKIIDNKCFQVFVKTNLNLFHIRSNNRSSIYLSVLTGENDRSDINDTMFLGKIILGRMSLKKIIDFVNFQEGVENHNADFNKIRYYKLDINELCEDKLIRAYLKEHPDADPVERYILKTYLRKGR